MPSDMNFSTFLLADNVYQDARSGKHIIAGTFSVLAAEALPGQFAHPVCLYLSFFGHAGPCDWLLRFLSPSGEELAQRPVVFEVQDPEEQVELSLDVPRLPLPEEGRYQFVLQDAQGHELARTGFRMMILPQP